MRAGTLVNVRSSSREVPQQLHCIHPTQEHGQAFEILRNT